MQLAGLDVYAERDPSSLLQVLKQLPEGTRIVSIYGSASGHCAWVLPPLQSVETSPSVNVTVATKPTVKRGK